jgi:hypothetical protein
MRVRPLTESARINESAAFSRPLDTLGGGRWVYDPKYGNFPACSPTTIGDSLRQSTSKKWLGRSTPKPPATAPPSLLHQPKWRGSFQTDFPPRSAVPADPLATNYGGYSGSSIGVQTWKHGAISMPWLHHTEEYVDHIHDTVAINAAHLPDTQRSNFRPVRQKAKELTGGDGRAQFWPQVPPGIVLPSPLSSCTWNRTCAPQARPAAHTHPATAQAAHTHPLFVSPIARSPKRVLRDHAAQPAATESILEKRPRIAGACEREQRRTSRAAGEWCWNGVLAVQLNAILVLVLMRSVLAPVALGRVRTLSVGVLRVRDESRS